MKLTFLRRHLSIVSFPTITIPSLTVILGINGSGKTHLLQAIQNGAIHNSLTSPPFFNNLEPVHPSPGHLPPKVPHSDINKLKLLTNDSFGTNSLQGRNQIYDKIYTNPSFIPGYTENSRFNFSIERNKLLEPFLSELKKAAGGSINHVIGRSEDVWSIDPEIIVDRLGGNVDRDLIIKIYENAAHKMLHTANFEFIEAKRAAQKLDISILKVSVEDLLRLAPSSYDQFEIDITEILGRYRDRHLENRMMNYQDIENGTIQALTKEMFEKIYGPPPWEILSQTFCSFGLPYEVVTPITHNFTGVSFRLRHVSTGEEIHPQALSSGESILFRFALSTFQVDNDMINFVRPKLLLMDELDAPLHPEMVHRWLNSISKELVETHGVTCVVTTHSPTTVALAPEEALYEMRDGQSGLIKITKQDALNKLTYGVPTLSIDYSGRRQVFAESDTDAGIYEAIYSIIKSRIKCKRELNFLSTSMRKKDGGEMNSGCTVVNNIVNSLRNAGNTAVYGIVDWDKENKSSDYVKVIAENRRDGIENILLDPLLVCLLLMRNRCAPQEIDDIKSFVNVRDLQHSDIQRLVNAIQYRIFPSNEGELIDVTYMNGLQIKVLKEYLLMDDHELEEKLAEEFLSLARWTRAGHGRLVKAIVEEVLSDYHAFCPIEIKEIFEIIANE